MNVFGEYSRYYDLLYRDKDYKAEADFVAGLILRYMPHASTILDLGCGTGIHASFLVQNGYTVCGLDFSEEMLKSAQERRSSLSRELASRLEFLHGDVRTIRLNRQFDVVISLFHVMSYQTTNEDLLAAFKTVREHLRPAGIFIFDCWYAPAVLTEKPSVRIKRLEDDEVFLTRIAEPKIHPNENTVNVYYQTFIRNKKNARTQELQEMHCMRYLFKPEIQFLCSLHNLEVVDHGEWKSWREPGFDTWSVCFVVRG